MYKKKLLILILVIFCLSFALSACSQRDLSSPSTRIVGHWKFGPITSCNCYDEYYFSPIDEESSNGDLIVVSQGSTFYQKWQLISEEKEGESIMYRVYNPITPDFFDINDLSVLKDGLSMINEYGKSYIYVDNKIKP